MSRKTENYQLNQWDPEDSFIRTDFNEDNAKIDAVLGLKSQLVMGTYVGDGTASQEINLGFTPKAVLVCSRSGQTNTGYYNYGGLALEGLPCTDKATKSASASVVAVTTTGFTVHSCRVSDSYFVRANEKEHTYYYLALK